MQTWLLRLGKLLFHKPRFRKWAELEDKKYSVIKAAEQGDDSLYLSVYDYISAALTIHPKDYSKIFWRDVIDVFTGIHNVTAPDKNLPIIKKQYDKKSQSDAWDYDGRLWFFYSQIIARTFGWSVKEIASLPVDDALAYVQEILTDDQLDREFLWSTSELAYKQDSITKQTIPIKLSRPYWMLPEFGVKEKKLIKIPVNLLPMGLVIKSKDKDETQETEPPRDNENLLAS